MKRKQLFEFEDLTWCPRTIRDGITSWLQYLIDDLEWYDTTAPIISDLMKQANVDTVVDLCSGGGGPWRRLHGVLSKYHANPNLVFTDKFPNHSALTTLVEKLGDNVKYQQQSVDATSLPDDLKGVFTMFTAVHHLPPELVTSVCKEVSMKRQPIAIFDIADRSHGSWFLRRLPIEMCHSIIEILRHSPKIKPRKISHMILTYLLPILPFCIVWDALASDLRAYEPEELEALANKNKTQDWVWKSGRIESESGRKVTFLIGHPN